MAASQGRMKSIRVILECVTEPKHKRKSLEMKDHNGNRPVDLVPGFRLDIKELLNCIEVKGKVIYYLIYLFRVSKLCLF